MQTTSWLSKSITDRAGGKSASFFPRTHRLLFGLVTALFFLWGLSNNLTDPLIQHLRKAFDLSPVRAQMVQTAVFCGYLCVALPAAALLRRFGYKRGILCGMVLFGAGMLMFWPAALLQQYEFFLAALFIIGCGSGILETGANSFVAQFGSADTSERRLNFSQAFNPPGTILGVLLGAYVVLSGVELSPAAVRDLQTKGEYVLHMHQELMRVVPVYAALGATVLLLALAIALLPFPTIESDDHHVHRGGLQRVLRRPALRRAIIAQFCCVGAQVSTWSAQFFYVRQYSTVTERSGFLYLVVALIAFALGRTISTAMMAVFRPARMLVTYAVVNIALLAVAVLHPGRIGVYCIVLTSFFMSIMFPTIFALGVKHLGPDTQIAGSLLVMSVGGGAVLPPLLGLVAGHFGSYALGYTVPLCGYIAVALFGWRSARTDAEDQISESVLCGADEATDPF